MSGQKLVLSCLTLLILFWQHPPKSTICHERLYHIFYTTWCWKQSSKENLKIKNIGDRISRNYLRCTILN